MCLNFRIRSKPDRSPASPASIIWGAAYAGIVSMGGEPDGAPYPIMTAIGRREQPARIAMAAICAALLYRETYGPGPVSGFVRCSIPTSTITEAGVETLSLSKGAISPTRSGFALLVRGSSRDFQGERSLHDHKSHRSTISFQDCAAR